MRFWLFPEHGAAYPDDAVSDEGKAHARPVAVIDYEDNESVARLAKAYRATWRGAHSGETPEDITIRQMREALREFATPTPPKPEEPQGLGAVVEDGEGRQFVRRCVCGGYIDWWPNGAASDHKGTAYDDIQAVCVLSQGVTL